MVGYLSSLYSACGYLSSEGKSAVEPHSQPTQGWLAVLSAWEDGVDRELLVDYTGRGIAASLSCQVYHFLVFRSKGDLISCSPGLNLP